MRGSAFTAGTVKITWGSAGTQLATTKGPNFGVPVKIPDVEPGVYYIVATVQTADGNTFTAKTPYEIAAPAEDATPPAAGGGSPASLGSPSPAAVTVGAGAPAVTTQGIKSPSSPKHPARGKGPSRTTSPVPSGGTRSGRTLSGSSHPVARQAPSSTPAAVTTRSGRVVFGGSIAPARADHVTRPVHPGFSSKGRRSEGARSLQTLALGDLSPGFGSPSKSSLVPDVTNPGHAEPAGTPLTAGMILLASGLMALFGSFLVAGLRRRRSSAAGPSQQ